jgi:hypothetical protein
MSELEVLQTALLLVTWDGLQQEYAAVPKRDLV